VHRQSRHPPRQLRIEPHDPILFDREIRWMQRLRFEEPNPCTIDPRRSGSIQSNTKAGASSRSDCIDAGDGVKAFRNERNLPWLWVMLPGATHWLQERQNRPIGSN
jgi:hypothetical protein